MKVILEAQHACTSTPRGIGGYSILLIRNLVKRAKNQYGLTFFDYRGQAGNRNYITQYFGDLHIPIFECNSLSYYDAFTKPTTKTYEEYTGAAGDVFHFMHYIKFPEHINGIPVITLHDTMPLTNPEWFEPRMVEYASIFAERIRRMRPLLLANSECTKTDIITNIGINDEDIVVIPISYDDENCYPEKGLDDLGNIGVRPPYLLYMGPIDERKNIRLLLKAFSRISDRFTEISLVIAGTQDKWSGASIYNTLLEFQRKAKVTLLTDVSDKVRRILYSNAIAFIFPSFYEGFGIPVLEAFACGCPVITSNTSALSETAGDAAILINPQSVDELEYQIERLISDSGLCKDLTDRGFKRVRDFSYDNTAKMTEEAYKLAVDRN